MAYRNYDEKNRYSHARMRNADPHISYLVLRYVPFAVKRTPSQMGGATHGRSAQLGWADRWVCVCVSL